MRSLVAVVLLGCLLVLYSRSPALAEIVTVAVDTAELRTSPALTTSYVVLEAPRYYPLLIQKERGDFYEVSDYQGRTGWIQKNQVDRTRGVVVEAEKADVRKGPDLNYPVLFQAYSGVSFKVLGESDGWLEIVHESGEKGWIYKALTWGQ